MKEFFRTLPWKLSRIEFYKKKPFTVVLTVIFSVLLVLTIGIRIFMPDMSNVSVPTASGSFDFSDMDSSEMEEMFGDMSDGDFSGGMDGMPSGDFSEGSDSMPSGDFSGDFGDFSGDFPDMSGDSDSSSDDSADDSTVESTGQTGILGFLQGWRSHWLIFFIIYAIADILCIIRLVILSRQKKKQLAEEAKQAREQMLAGEVVHVAHPVKKQKVNSAAVWAIPMVGVILLVAIVNAMTAQTTVSASQTEATTYSGTVETVSMDTVLPGAGTLEEEDADEIELLSDVEVSKWYVSDGDTVEEGDTLALVDTVSVMSAIASIQEQLDALDAELAECEDEEIEETITAAADGRVMAIYAKEDTAVTDTMYEYSALMLISLDGYLCVSMESDADLSVGDSVVVTLSDDATVDGKVSSVISGTITVLVSDEEASLGESVSVATEDGDAVGEGTLSINSALTVTGYAGTVSEIEVSVGDEVESGDTLLTLTDTEYAGTYENLLTQRGELEEAMQELFILYQDPYLYATSDGVISGIDSSSSSDDSDSDDSDSDDDSDDSDSDDDSDDSDSDDDSESSDSSSSSDDSNSNDSDDSDSDSSDGTDSSSNADSDGVVVVSAGVGSAVLSSTVQADDTAAEQLASVTVEENVISISTSSAENDSTFAASTEADTTSDSLDGENTSDNDISSYTNLIGVVTSVADGVATIIYLPDTYTISDYTDLSGIDLDTDLMTQTGTLKTSSSYLMFTYTGSSFSIGTAADLAEGNTVVLAYDSDGSLVWIVCVDVTEDDSDGDGSDDSDSGSSSGSSSGSDSGSSSGSSSGSDSGSSSGSSSGSDSSSGSGSSASGTDSSVYGSTGSDSSSSGVYGSTDSDSSLYSTYGSTDSDSSSSSIWGSISDYDTSSISTDSTDSDSTYSSSVDLSTLTGVTTDSTTDSLYSDSSDTDTSATEDSSGSYSVSRMTAVSITPQDTMSITITVDELDILSLEVGQTAEVTLDAFPGQSFEGKVTSIDLTGTNSGGSTKFTAVVTIDREEDMLVGMNASASIVIDTTEDVLCITEAALLEEDGAVYVYTTYDEKTDTFGGLVEVTTGISDGENVEILSGLAEGDTYYYSYLDVVNYSTSSSSSGSSFSFSSMFGSGGGGGGMSMP